MSSTVPKTVYEIAVESIEAGAPGLSDAIRRAIARNIAAKVETLGAVEDDDKCGPCHGTGRHMGAFGGPNWPRCGHCGGTGRQS